jgi:PAS domain-containing protein
MNDNQMSRTVDLIYDAAVAPSLVPDMMRGISGGMNCHFGGMVTSSADRGAFAGMCVGVDRETHQAFLRRFHRESPLILAAPPLLGTVQESRAMMSPAEFERTEMFQMFHGPHDLCEGVRLTIWQNEWGQQTISLCRSWSRGPFEAEELAAARALMPHLRRMAMVARHLRGAELLARSAHAALNALPQPVLLLDRQGRMVFANTAGETLVAGGDGLAVGRVGLTASQPAAARQLEAVIARAARAPGGTAGTLRLPRPSGQPPLAVVVMPLRREWLDVYLMPELPAVLVCVSDPASRHHPRPTMLARLFGLTSAEADVAARLLTGEEVRSIAARIDRSVHAVRHLLARLMARTETWRARELVRLLGGVAARREVD